MFNTNSFSLITNGLWLFILFGIPYLLSFIYMNEKHKNESLTISQEVNLLKSFQEKEKFRNKKQKDETNTSFNIKH